MITTEGIDDIVVNGGIVITSDGATIGSVEQIFLSADTNEPAFVTVRTGFVGMLESFVPLAGARIEGSRVVVVYDRRMIRNGPRIESDRGKVTADEEFALCTCSSTQPLATHPRDLHHQTQNNGAGIFRGV